ncbi:MAG: hypothetical protein ABJA93_04850 [Sporichthyaceae bacterium]
MSAGVDGCALDSEVVSLAEAEAEVEVEVEVDGDRVGAALPSSPLQAAVRRRISAQRTAAGRVIVRAFPGRAPFATSPGHEGGKSLSRGDVAMHGGYLDFGL